MTRIAHIDVPGSTVPRAAEGFVEEINPESFQLSSECFAPITNTVIDDWLRATGVVDIDLSYDIFYIDDPSALYAAPIIKSWSDAKIIYFFSDNRPFGLQCYAFNDDSSITSLVRSTNRALETVLLRSIISRYVDGIISVSQMIDSYLSNQISARIPTRIAPIYILPDIWDELSSVTPKTDQNIAITVARGIETKGADLLHEAWLSVLDEFPDAELHIVGDGHPEEFASTQGVTLHGFVDHKKIPSKLAQASLFVNPARVDAFPMAVLEAMLAGLPPLVTSMTGSKNEVRSIDTNLIVSPTSTSIAEGLQWYFSCQTTERGRMSDAAKDITGRYSAKNRRNDFKEKFYSLVNEIG